MFGIGLPEMILILALALIVVGPDKLPDLARSVAKGIMELKKTAETLKKNLTEDGTLDTLKSELNDAAMGQQSKLIESSSDQPWKRLTPGEGVNPGPDETEKKTTAADATLPHDIGSSPTDEQAKDTLSEVTDSAPSEKTAPPAQHDASQKP